MTDRIAALPDIPDDLQELMAEVGPRGRDSVAKNVDLMIQRFSEVLKRSPRDGVTVHAGISYGNHERNAFDVFLPESMATPPPVVLFVHGGAFVSGRRNRTEQIYSNVLYYLARHGIAGINIGYRLANDAVYPAATNDIATAVAWAHAHPVEFGSDPAPNLPLGHSAGAAHAGRYAHDPLCRPACRA